MSDNHLAMSLSNYVVVELVKLTVSVNIADRSSNAICLVNRLLYLSV